MSEVKLGRDPKLSELIAWAEDNGLELKVTIDRPMITLQPIKVEQGTISKKTKTTLRKTKGLSKKP